MTWIESCPPFAAPVVCAEPVLSFIDIPHSSLIGLLTNTDIILLNKLTLIPVAFHQRAQESIESHGVNKSLHTKFISVNTAQLQKIPVLNLFVETTQNYLLIFQISVDSSESLFEIDDESNYTLQKGMPLSVTSQKFSLSKIFKAVTTTLINGSSVVELENIEHFNNSSIEDETDNFEIEAVKLAVYKIIKISIGITRLWLKQNSHNLIIYKRVNPEDAADTRTEDSVFQIVNIKTLKSEVFDLSSMNWYRSSPISLIQFNPCQNYFVFQNKEGELWVLLLDKSQDGTMTPSGYRIGSLSSNVVTILFNPVYNLAIFQYDDALKLHNIEKNSANEYVFTTIMTYDLPLGTPSKFSIQWSSDGAFFTALNEESGYWLISSKFGCIYSSTLDIANEMNHSSSFNKDFLTASSLLIHSNALNLYVINKQQTQIYFINLQGLLDKSNLAFLNSNYISIVDNYKLIKFPLLARFKNILANLEHYNGNGSKSMKSLNGSLRLSVNKYHQIAISFGNALSLSTPYKTGDSIHQLLWFNFKNYYMETLNVVNHVFFGDYLIVINRTVKEEKGEDCLVDEMILLNIADSRLGAGGWNYIFDSNVILWRQTFNSRVLAFEVVEASTKPAQLVLLESNMRILVFELSADYTATSTSEKNGGNTNTDYKLFIKVVKTIYLSSIKHRLPISEITEIKMVNDNHFLFLLSNGDFFLLKNQYSGDRQSVSQSPVDVLKPTNYYELIKINEATESFKVEYVKIKTLIEYVYLFQGNKVLIYNMEKLLDLSFDASGHVNDGIEEVEVDKFIKPIVIDVDNFQPLKLENYKQTSINLIGLESLLIQTKNDNIVLRNKLNFKLVLNNLIEFDLINNESIDSILFRFQQFQNFDYCVELLLFKYLTGEDEKTLKRLIKLLKKMDDYDSVVINCLRKIEIVYWHKFFKYLEMTPLTLMNKILADANVELCYNFLIVYLNSKKENEEADSLDNNDKEIILKIFELLTTNLKWGWCFELCRFIKLLDPSSEFLKAIKNTIEG